VQTCSEAHKNYLATEFQNLIHSIFTETSYKAPKNFSFILTNSIHSN